LHLEAYEAHAIPVLKKLIDQASVDPFPYPTPALIAQSAMLREVEYQIIRLFHHSSANK
jgi:hypothetical protein